MTLTGRYNSRTRFPPKPQRHDSRSRFSNSYLWLRWRQLWSNKVCKRMQLGSRLIVPLLRWRCHREGIPERNRNYWTPLRGPCPLEPLELTFINLVTTAFGKFKSSIRSTIFLCKINPSVVASWLSEQKYSRYSWSNPLILIKIDFDSLLWYFTQLCLFLMAR